MSELDDIIFPKEREVMSGEKEKETAKRVLKFEIYKGQGAMQFKLAPAWSITDKRTGQLKDKGCIFVDAAPSVGKRKYGFQDPEKKVTFALGIADIGKILTGFKLGKFSLVHDPGAQTDRAGQITKTLSMWKGENDKDGLPTYFLKLVAKEGSKTREVKVSLTAPEARVLSELLAAAIPRILYWS